MRTTVIVLLLVCFVAIPAFAEGEPAAPGNDAQEDLARQVEELKRLLEEIKGLNQEQIEQLQQRIRELESRLAAAEEDRAEDELAELRAAAEEATAKEAQKEKEAEDQRKTATGRQRSLQASNPEISFLGDVSYDWTSGPMKDGFVLRGAELGLQAALDPYTRFKAFIVGHQEPFELELEHEHEGEEEEEHGHEHGTEIGVSVEEAYMEWVALPTHMRLTVGKFRQQYGTLNRWHPHGLPTVDIPFALRNTFGHDGLIGLGISLDWQLPRAWASSNGLTLQVTNADNPVAFAGSEWRDPAFLLRHTGFFDLGPDSYFDLGLNAAWGANDASGDNHTLVAGIDFNYLWEPVRRARYRNVEFRGEWIYTQAQEPGDFEPESNSFYLYASGRLSRRWTLGVRLDDAEIPFDRYHLVDPETMEELEFREGLRERAVTPFLTYWQSEFVRLRFQYQYAERDFIAHWGGDVDNKLWVQVTFAAGPHKHESY